MSDELKPCPFCGSTPRVKKWRGADPLGVGCETCDVGPGMHDEAGPVANVMAWDTRPIEDALRAELVELRAKWASVPWDDINVALFEVFHDGDCHCDHCGRLNNAIATAEDWYDANKPKEPTE